MRKSRGSSFRALMVCLTFAATLFVAHGCTSRPIRPNDPMADKLDASRYLGLPISSLEHGFPNVFGPAPILAAGVPIRVVGILSDSRTYQVQIKGPRECSPYCVVKIEESGARARERFDAIFVTHDPLSGLTGEEQSHVREHRVQAGMRGATVRLALGEPDKIERTEHKGSVAERWVYNTRTIEERRQVRLEPRLALVFVADRLMDYEYL